MITTVFDWALSHPVFALVALVYLLGAVSAAIATFQTAWKTAGDDEGRKFLEETSPKWIRGWAYYCLIGTGLALVWPFALIWVAYTSE